MRNVLTTRLKSLPSKKLKQIIRKKKKKFLIVNDFNPNDIFEVEASDSNNAAHAALAQLGWWMAEDA
jgi:hypothetical protein